MPVGTSATLTWTISNGTCTASADQVILTNSTVPSTAAAGPDQNICGTSVVMAGNTAVSGTGTWTLVSGPNSPNIVSPNAANTSIGGLASGVYVFQWSINNPGCVASTDQVSVTVTTSALTANANVDQSQCGSGSFTLSGSISGGGNVNWSVVSGTATITTLNSLTSTVTGVPAGSSATIQLTTTSGACSASDQVVLTNNAVPTMSSASALTICSGTAVNLSLTSSVGSTYSWVATSNGNVTGESTVAAATSTISDVLTNTSSSTSADQTVVYTVTPTAT
ncbi:MAG: PKD-like domain-containing protein, partial [Flavobacteriia bacterium]